MSILERSIKLAGSKGEGEVIAIFDSGSTYSCIAPELAQKLEVVVNIPQPMEFGTAERGRKIVATQRVSLDFYIDGYRFSDEFMIIPKLSESAIIGATTMQKWRIKLNFETEEVIIDPRVTKLRFF